MNLELGTSVFLLASLILRPVQRIQVVLLAENHRKVLLFDPHRLCPYSLYLNLLKKPQNLWKPQIKQCPKTPFSKAKKKKKHRLKSKTRSMNIHKSPLNMTGTPNPRTDALVCTDSTMRPAWTSADTLRTPLVNHEIKCVFPGLF